MDGAHVSSVVTSIIEMLNCFVWNPLLIYVGESLTIHATCCSGYACLHNCCVTHVLVHHILLPCWSIQGNDLQALIASGLVGRLQSKRLTPTAASEYPTRCVRLACFDLQLNLQTSIAGATFWCIEQRLQDASLLQGFVSRLFNGHWIAWMHIACLGHISIVVDTDLACISKPSKALHGRTHTHARTADIVTHSSCGVIWK